MTEPSAMVRVLRNMLQHGDLPFRDFVEVALYHPEHGYYTRGRNPVGREGDFVTSPHLSSVFSFTLGKLVREFLSRAEDDVCTIVDIGCGDGKLIRELSAIGGARYIGVDRTNADFRTIDEIPRGGAHLIFSNELFDALPFARLVKRGDDLHELWVDENLEWTEHEAEPRYSDYFASRGIQLADGQFADVSLEWEALYADIAHIVERGLIVTFDYGYPGEKLFHSRVRHFGTAAAYSQQRVTRDLLANPGEQDLTAHINFTDLIRAGEACGFSTRFFDRQAKFLLALGATEHDLFRPVTELETASIELMQQRDEARQLVLPDGIGHDIRVLAQVKSMGEDAWSFERFLF
ncbi:MAG TPA: SAM-dependent methyltransferase [Thermoanaerobaculia bacterium]|nr:SAM-dependent methyltransferase [Thermoanaerobaculia bacterium]